MSWRRVSTWAIAVLALASAAPMVWAQPPPRSGAEPEGRRVQPWVSPPPRPLKEGEIPAGLPRYDLDIVLDVGNHLVKVREIVTWTNTTNVPARELVFNAHSHYSVPDTIRDHIFLAKMVELLRMSPKEAISYDGPALAIHGVKGPNGVVPCPGLPDWGRGIGFVDPSKEQKPFYWDFENSTALHVPLIDEVAPGQSVTVELDFELKLPPKKGRWGQWDGITTLAQWLPVLAVYDAKGWQPTPFIPWHQPYYNEAGIYTAKVRLPADQMLAASASVRKETRGTDGWRDVEFEPICLRDFALIASARFQEWIGEVDGIKIRCLAPPEHAFYAEALLECARETIPVYSRWFGKFPYKQFTIVEACFGWAGNECGGLVMIDDRMFNMPHIARNYPVFLLQHEICHQWWYNAVGTNGYAETWMDEGLATYFSHRLADRTMGKNNDLIDFPKGLGWMPNIKRDDFRNYGMVGAWARGEANPCVQDMPKYGHLVNLTSACYDRGSKVVGMIEERLGEQAFFDFMRHVYRKYYFRILLVADFQRELEAYTGYSWSDFFHYWVYGSGMCDWAVERVEIDGQRTGFFHKARKRSEAETVRVTVHLKQRGDFNEPTTLGIRLEEGGAYQIRLPIQPGAAVISLPDQHAVITCTDTWVGEKQHACVKVEITLPCEPVQISVDPDKMLLDNCPCNNHWKREFRWRLTPLYTLLDEVDVTNAVDQINITAGPWAYFSSYNDPWYTKSMMAGFRLGLFRTQEVEAAGYLAYRSNDRNIVAGADLFWDHALLPHVQMGLNVEKSLDTLSNSDIPTSRAVAYARYVLMYGSSLYLPPFEYIEAFGVTQNRGLPDPITAIPNTSLFNDRTALGLHYHKNLMTPYWDPESGFSIDAAYQYGLPIFGTQESFQLLYGQVAYVQSLPRLGDSPFLKWLSDSRLAFRLGAAAGFPNDGLFFSLGGGDNFRGFDLAQRQGSMLWLGSFEWRVPICTDLHYDFVDHVGSVRNVYFAPFYDVGNAYANGREVGAIAHAVGAGLRIDVTWLGLIERTTLRFDIAKTVNGSYPVQFWVGIQHPF